MSVGYYYDFDRYGLFWIAECTACDWQSEKFSHDEYADEAAGEHRCDDA